MGTSAFSMAVPYRMNGLFPGAVQRTHPFSVEPNKLDPTVVPPVTPGLAFKLNATGDAVMPIGSGDTAVTHIYGINVRPYPTQLQVVSPSGQAVNAPPEIDILRYGYIGVVSEGAASGFVKGGAVYVDTANGKFAAATGSGIAGPMVNAKFNGPPDAQGNVEVIVTEWQG